MSARSIIRVLALSLLVLAGTKAQAATLPANFYDTLVNPNANMTNPTAMAIAPDGRIFVCQQGGALRVIKNGALLPAAFFTIPAATISSAGERGLLGVAFDPNFTGNRYVYIYSTHIEPSGPVTFAGATTVSGPVTYNHVSRLTADAANPDVALAGSEVNILNMYPLTAATNHNGGAMHFGLDGKLYVAAGENATNTNAQLMTNLLGKISRINPDGSIPTDNPFYGTASGNNRAIWVWGLRNPFTFNIQEGTGRIFINDVGNLTWEEINDGVPGANYGWPTTEGAFVEATYPNFKHPSYFYQSNGGPCAITGGAFVDPGNSMFPAAYTGKYYFADYCGGWIRYINTPAAGVTLPEASYTAFTGATGYTSPVGLEVGPDGALYVLTGANSGNGRVFRIHYSASAAPVISTNPSSVTVTVGQNAGFNVTASGAGPVTYQWQRNGVDIAGTNSSIYTLNNAQLSDSGAVFRVIVSNMSGSVTSTGATLTVTTNTPPVPVIVTPTAGTMFNAGTTITFSGSATDAQDGTMTAGSFTWWIDLQHDTHAHPAMPATSGVTTGTFVIPNTGHYEDTIWYRIYLVVTDSGGMATTVIREIFPNKVDLVFQTVPMGLDVTLEGIPLTTPATEVSVVGMIRDFGAPNQGGYVFASWSDGGAQNHSVTVGASSITYTANFTGPTATRTSTSTLTPSRTPTASATSTLSSTPTMTSTRTSSSTSTPSSTPSATSTPTSSATSTLTVSPTRTSSATPTMTNTQSRTPTASATSTTTSTLTVSPTQTSTTTSTGTLSSTRTSTLTATQTLSATPSLTASPTVTLTSTGTQPPTLPPTATLTLTVSPTPTATSSPTSSATATVSPTSTATASATTSPTPSSTATATSSLTSTTSPVPTDTSTETATVTVTPTSSSTPTGTLPSTLTSTTTATPSMTHTVTVSPTPTLSVTFTPTSTPSTPTAVMTSTPSPTSTLGSNGSITKSASRVWIYPDDTVTVSLSVTVTGGVLTNVHITDALYTNMIFVSFGSLPSGATASYDANTQTLTWDLVSLPPGVYTLTYQFRVDDSGSPGIVISSCANMTVNAAYPPFGACWSYILGYGSCEPYPNPATGSTVTFCVPGSAQVEWSLYTVSYKKVASKKIGLTAAETLVLDLIDDWGRPLANGLYYLKVNVDKAGPGGKSEKIYKIIVRR